MIAVSRIGGAANADPAAGLVGAHNLVGAHAVGCRHRKQLRGRRDTPVPGVAILGMLRVEGGGADRGPRLPAHHRVPELLLLAVREGHPPAHCQEVGCGFVSACVCHRLPCFCAPCALWCCDVCEQVQYGPSDSNVVVSVSQSIPLRKKTNAKNISCFRLLGMLFGKKKQTAWRTLRLPATSPGTEQLMADNLPCCDFSRPPQNQIRCVVKAWVLTHFVKNQCPIRFFSDHQLLTNNSLMY